MMADKRARVDLGEIENRIRAQTNAQGPIPLDIGAEIVPSMLVADATTPGGSINVGAQRNRQFLYGWNIATGAGGAWIGLKAQADLIIDELVFQHNNATIQGFAGRVYGVTDADPFTIGTPAPFFERAFSTATTEGSPLLTGGNTAAVAGGFQFINADINGLAATGMRDFFRLTDFVMSAGTKAAFGITAAGGNGKGWLIGRTL